MSKWKWLVPVLVLGMVGIADAKKNKNNNPAGIKGKIVSISAKQITIQTGHKKNGGAQPMVIPISATTTIEINSAPNMKVTDLQAGQKVVVQEDQNGVATDIQASKGKHGRHKRA